MNIVTGYRGEPHITAQQDRFVNQSSIGTDSYVLPVGNQLSATIDSATQITLADGGVSIQGCVGIIDYGQTEAVTIESGTVGMGRIDLICAEYTKDSNGIEDINIVVKTGTATTGTPEAPEYTTGTIAGGDTVVDFPIYRVTLDGVAIDSVTMIASVSQTLEEIAQEIASPLFKWKIFSTGSTTFATGTTTHTVVTSFPSLSGYTRWVFGLRSISNLVSVSWRMDGDAVVLYVYNDSGSAVTTTVTGFACYFLNSAQW